MLTIDLFRHAECDLNKEEEFIGGRSNSSPLSARGEYQALLLAKRLKLEGVRYDLVRSSPAVRAVGTAEIACGQIGFDLDKIVLDPDLQELDQGEWEHRLRSEIYTPEAVAVINSNNWDFTPPGGESQRMVEERIYTPVKVLECRWREGLNVGMFTHGMAIKCLLRKILDFSPKMTYKIALDNASLTRLTYTERGWHVLCINEAGHLVGTEKLKDRYSR